TDQRWEWKNPSYVLNAGAFNWQDVYTVNISPYASYEAGDLKIRGNVFYLYNYEYLDGYANADETTAVSGWGGAHSNWVNTSAGFNIFPSYKLAAWNSISASLLFRWDKHLERQQADSQFVGGTSACADASYALAGYSWYDTKLMTGEQITVALEDQIELQKAIGIPVEISVGISYDAQKLDTFKKRSETRAAGVVTSYGTTMDDQYIAKEDSLIWGTRDSFNPVVGVVYEPLKDFFLLRASYSQKSKLPTMAQYSKMSSSLDTGDLKTEKSYNTNAGFEFFLLNKTISFRTDYFFSRFDDKIATIYNPDVAGNKVYTNIKGEDHQGVEFIITAGFEDLFGIISSVDTEFSYTYLRVRNLDTGNQDSELYKGEKLTDIPEHQVLGDVRFNFITGTSLNLFGSYSANAIKYVMKAGTTNGTVYSNSYYKEIKLHDPLMINIKVSQTFLNRYEVFAMCKNIMDDYAADPFNPGAGRQFSFGVKAEL
ncbi:MAG: TonB-dependent receptor, partial [Spirochaetes bacterium]|nr:TonB-dependent receptor [Spirochaetota bacterium]